MIKGRVVGSGDTTCTIEVEKEALPESLRAVGAAVVLELSPAGGVVSQNEARHLLNYLLRQETCIN